MTKSWKRQRQILRRVSGGTNPAFISDFQPPDLGERTFRMTEPSGLGCFAGKPWTLTHHGSYLICVPECLSVLGSLGISICLRVKV